MKAWVFDIDGVITNLQSKKLEHPQILEIIIQKLRNGDPVCLVTGRKIDTAYENVIKPLEQLSSRANNLDLLCLEGEFGAISLYFENGIEKIYFDERYITPEKLLEKGKKIIDEYKEYVFFDQKKSFFTAEMNHGGNIEDFKKIQSEIANKLENLINQMNLTNNFEVHQDTIAINVKNKKLNKYLATNKFLKWLEGKKINPEFYYIFGDSESDFQIGEELQKQNRQILFVYTGEKPINKYGFKIEKTQKPYDLGTLEFLQTH